MAPFSADDITYPPLDVPKPVADGIWIVDSGPLRVFGVLGLPIRMTVLRLSSGDMLMHSPTRFDARLKAEIEAHGPIRHLVAPNIAHWSFLAEWQRAVIRIGSPRRPKTRRGPLSTIQTPSATGFGTSNGG